jgi:hypothetical protein
MIEIQYGNFLPWFKEHATEGMRLLEASRAAGDIDGENIGLGVLVFGQRMMERAGEVRTLGIICATVGADGRRAISPTVSVRLSEIITSIKTLLTESIDCIGSNYPEAQRLEAQTHRFRSAIENARAMLQQESML